MKKIFTIILLLGLCSVALSQNKGKKLTDSDIKLAKQFDAFAEKIKDKEFNALMLPGKDIYGYLLMLGQTLTEWKRFIDNDFDSQGIGAKGQTYFTVKNKKGSTYTIERYINGSIHIIHTFNDGNFYFNELLKELKPYYITTHKNGFEEYGLKQYSDKYRFIIKRTHNKEIIIAEKF